jgi:hypothetical protein
LEKVATSVIFRKLLTLATLTRGVIAPVLEQLLQEWQLFVVVRRVADGSDLFSDESQIPDQDGLVVRERVERFLK